MKSLKPPAKSKRELSFDFIQANPIANIILSGNDFHTTCAPVLAEGSPDDFVLFGHIAKHNAQYKYLDNKKRALIIFQEKDLCTSALYRAEEQHVQAFSAVHINGELKLQTDEELRICMKKTYQRLLQFYGRENTCLKKLNETIERQLQLLTGFWCYPSLISPISRLYQQT